MPPAKVLQRPGPDAVCARFLDAGSVDDVDATLAYLKGAGMAGMAAETARYNGGNPHGPALDPSRDLDEPETRRMVAEGLASIVAAAGCARSDAPVQVTERAQPATGFLSAWVGRIHAVAIVPLTCQSEVVQVYWVTPAGAAALFPVDGEQADQSGHVIKVPTHGGPSSIGLVIAVRGLVLIKGGDGDFRVADVYTDASDDPSRWLR